MLRSRELENYPPDSDGAICCFGSGCNGGGTAGIPIENLHLFCSASWLISLGTGRFLPWICGYKNIENSNISSHVRCFFCTQHEANTWVRQGQNIKGKLHVIVLVSLMNYLQNRPILAVGAHADTGRTGPCFVFF